MAPLIFLTAISILPKDQEISFVDGLSHEEFRCRCESKLCHYTLVSKKLLNAYNLVRLELGVPLTINSGFRCQGHNIKKGGSDTSSHTTGFAIDISFENLTKKQIKKLIRVADERFDYTLVYMADQFIHCHMEGK